MTSLSSLGRSYLGQTSAKNPFGLEFCLVKCQPSNDNSYAAPYYDALRLFCSCQSPCGVCTGSRRTIDRASCTHNG